MNNPQTASQTVGPFFHNALILGTEHVLTNQHTRGQRIRLQGTVFDGDGLGVPDAMLEIWQADAGGFYNHPRDPDQNNADPNFSGFGRGDTVKNGMYSFETIKPGAREGVPFVNVRLFMRGLLIHLTTRLYFPDENNAADPVFASLEPARRQRLIATRQDLNDVVVYRFDIHLQGELETVFFDA